MANRHIQLISLIVLFVCMSAMFSVSEAQVDNIMGCVFCQLITESIAKELSPPHAFNTMYRRCSKMGLMEPVCDQFIEENAKKMFLLHRSGLGPEGICQKMGLCQVN